MPTIQERIKHITATIPTNVRLVAVSKYQPEEYILDAYSAGQRIFGESHAQELRLKHEHLPKDIEWHFIGHLQTNKVKYIAPFIAMIHSVDSFRLLEEINKQAAKAQRTIPCLIQVHIAQEETKFGFTPEECVEFFAQKEWQQFKHIKIKGLMCMASNTEDEDRIKNEFRSVHELFLHIKNNLLDDKDDFTECSWGMSDDYPIAIDEGSTLVRIGSLIFGERG
ncbi:MAG: YggS family pyridoxal phosphate-dependent enzyme [Paraprevotella sp.]|nr:YggS family pyridoxal phosphate-dependent enzyme [Paraprevotella sp.]